jgi:hypothetical protein
MNQKKKKRSAAATYPHAMHKSVPVAQPHITIIYQYPTIEYTLTFSAGYMYNITVCPRRRVRADREAAAVSPGIRLKAARIEIKMGRETRIC